MFDVHFLFGIFGNITALILFFVPVITFRKIFKMKSTDQFSGIPYMSALLNCLLSAWYGLPFISPNNILISTINGTGIVIQLCYVIFFLFYVPDKKYKAKIFGLLVIVLLAFGIIALVSVFALHGNGRKFVCGFAAAICSICMYASPLSIMRLVIKTKSVKYMPFFLSLFVFLCGSSWFVFGLTGGDLFIAVPNGIGSVLGAMQLILYSAYKEWRSIGKSRSTSEGKQARHESEMEMGYPRANGSGVIQSEKRMNNI